jgi:hypothetical protein
MKKNTKVVGNIKTMGGAFLQYFTYFLIFPDETVWVDQTPFAGRLDDELNRVIFGRVPKLRKSLLNTGECSWKDQNGVWHRIKVEKRRRPKVWGRGNDYAKHDGYRE